VRIIAACSSYWNSQEEFDARYEGKWIQRIDPRTFNVAYQLNPVYNGIFGLREWERRVARFFCPRETLIACGTWSDPDFSRFGRMVKIINSGAEPNHAHTGSWQYMGCALTALMANLCNRKDWDLLIFFDSDVLIGAVDWDALLREFMSRPEEVFGPRWYNRHCDFLGWKPAAASRFLHQRIRCNLSDDDSIPWIDDELHRMFDGRKWNPWPEVECIRQDYAHDEGAHLKNASASRWPIVRLPHPDIIPGYLATQTVLARSVKQA